jgi:hypothetical protein
MAPLLLIASFCIVAGAVAMRVLKPLVTVES